jgi:hypothetical protein
MMRKSILLVLLISFYTAIYAQCKIDIDICNGTGSNKLYDTSWVKVLYFENDTFLVRTKNKILNNTIYFDIPYIERNNDKHERRYFREDSTGSVYIYDTLNNQEILFIPSNEGMKGKEFSYKWLQGFMSSSIIDYHAQLSTPYCNYTDLIKLGEKKMNHPLDYRYFSYYKRGIGFVAKAIDDDIYIFLEAMYIEK